MCFPSDGLGEVGGEQARLAPQVASPPGMVVALQHLDDVAGHELQLVHLSAVVTVQSDDPQGGGEFALDTEDGETQTDKGY